ncbi:hypothetical protein GLOIN_2v1776429 [Rhizophagus clarus]|uniref:Uncharacterized protein n=1 Tax=Rhizophagus clarus TaxID=94130 RepID=A0A8H3LEP5_9GLOM|nr:hypothetical protein GLOIN_2v1776429 [Rhizophagus clarus]
MVQKDFEDDNISGEEYNEYGDGDDDLEQRSDDDHIEQRSDNGDDLEQRSNDDHLEQRSDNDHLEQRNDNDDDLEQRSNNEEVMKNMKQCRQIMKKDMISDISEEKLFVDEALAKDKLPSYDDLVDIIMRPEFNRDHIVKNIRRFRAWRERLPLPSISAKSISISSKKTPSTLKDSKMAYQLSISDIIWNVLNNPSLLKEMYFGAGVDSKTKSEEPTVSAEIQKVLDYSDLPGTFKGELRQNRSLSGEVWLQDEPFLTITTSQISEKVAADTLRITEILYKHHTHWRIRDATFSYQHPSEYISIRAATISNNSGGVYVQFGNMPARQRKLLKNHLFSEFEQGKLMEVNGQDAWVIAGLGVVTADLPQGK